MWVLQLLLSCLCWRPAELNSPIICIPSGKGPLSIEQFHASWLWIYLRCDRGANISHKVAISWDGAHLYIGFRPEAPTTLGAILDKVLETSVNSILTLLEEKGYTKAHRAFFEFATGKEPGNRELLLSDLWSGDPQLKSSAGVLTFKIDRKGKQRRG